MILKITYALGGLVMGLGMSFAQGSPAQSPHWLTGLNTLLLTGTMSLLGWSLLTTYKVGKRQDVLEAALFKGTSVTNGARQFILALETNFSKLNERIEKLSHDQGERIQTVETTLWGVKGHGGLFVEIKSLRETRHEHNNRIMVMAGRIEGMERDLRLLRKKVETIANG